MTTASLPGPSTRPRSRRVRSGLGALIRGRGKAGTQAVRLLFLALAAGLDAVAILVAAAASGSVFGTGTDYYNVVALGPAVAALFVVPAALRHDYSITRYLAHKGHIKRSLGLWGFAVVAALVLAFIAKTTDSLSRGGTITFVVAGFTGLVSVRAALVQIMTTRASAGRVASRHIFLVGDEDIIRAFATRHPPHEVGLRIVGATVLRPGAETLGSDLALAAASARVLRPDDVYILVPWADRTRLESAIDTFMGVPATIQLAPEPFFDKFDDLHIVRTGSLASVHLVRRPLSSSEVVAKRIVDVVLASLALVLLAPLFVAVAILIRLESRGPVFFLQSRYGFNQEPFRILKFRSMTALEDGRAVRQVTAQDRRVTRVGRFIRRTNIDELPQLLNVLRGDMSLVGPRPHALAHDQAFEREVARYARRHNVRPGITGWAQINGWRGETDTAEKVRGRVEHDLFYIDNWSLLFDLVIMIRTVFSRKAYRNAQ